MVLKILCVGEEEAIFSWAATNFLMGTLLPASQGLGVVLGVNSTYGTIDLGGASTQIAYFLPSQDILEGLYKFQLGGQKVWNVYTKSFLQFGIVSARQRHIAWLIDDYFEKQPSVSANGDANAIGIGANSIAANSMHANSIYTNSITAYKHNKDKDKDKNVPSGPVVRIENSCFYAGYSEKAVDASNTHNIEVTGPELPQADQMQRCQDLIRPLMEKKFNAFCNEVYHGDCSIAGLFQSSFSIFFLRILNNL